MTKRALHKGQVIFLQLNPSPGRLNCSMNTSLGCCSDVGAGWQDPNSGNIKARAQAISTWVGIEVGSLICSGSCPPRTVCLCEEHEQTVKEVTLSAVRINDSHMPTTNLKEEQTSTRNSNNNSSANKVS